MANQLFSGSICLTDLIEQAKKQHSAFSKANNGKIYANVTVWLNEQTDQYGNQISIQLRSKKELREKEGKIYVGNAKPNTQDTAITPQEANNLGDDLPF